MTGSGDEALVDEPHCEECSRLLSRSGSGWHAEEAADGARILYCPDCWDREFGDGDTPDRAALLELPPPPDESPRD